MIKLKEDFLWEFTIRNEPTTAGLSVRAATANVSTRKSGINPEKTKSVGPITTCQSYLDKDL